MKKIIVPTELTYILGLTFTAMGVLFMTFSDFGVSMVVAPCYLIYLKVSQTLPFFTFGMSEYLFQAVVLIVLCLLLRKFKLSYLFSFITAVVYGTILDLLTIPMSHLPQGDSAALRLVYYVLGLLVCAFGIALMFRTYISQEVYELFVKECARAYRMKDYKFKQIYDACSLAVGLVLMFALFGFWPPVGINWGTFVCAAINGSLIGFMVRTMEKYCEFKDFLPFRKYFLDAEDTL